MLQRLRHVTACLAFLMTLQIVAQAVVCTAEIRGISSIEQSHDCHHPEENSNSEPPSCGHAECHPSQLLSSQGGLLPPTPAGSARLPVDEKVPDSQAKEIHQPPQIA